MSALINHAKAAATTAWMNSFGARGDFEALKRDTAVVYADVIPPEVCEQLIARIDEIADTPAHPRVWRDKAASDTRILGFEKLIPELMDYFDVEQQIRRIDAYLGWKTKAWVLMANRVVPQPNNLGSGGGLHRDSPFSHQVKCIWYLNDVTAANGPFCYVKGTHINIFQMRHVYPLGQTRFDRIEGELTEVHAKAGSLLVCDTKCIHGGKPIESGARYAVTLYTFPKTSNARAMYQGLGLDPGLSGY